MRVQCIAQSDWEFDVHIANVHVNKSTRVARPLKQLVDHQPFKRAGAFIESDAAGLDCLVELGNRATVEESVIRRGGKRDARASSFARAADARCLRHSTSAAWC
jgi:hypothetical protein